MIAEVLLRKVINNFRAGILGFIAGCVGNYSLTVERVAALLRSATQTCNTEPRMPFCTVDFVVRSLTDGIFQSICILQRKH